MRDSHRSLLAHGLDHLAIGIGITLELERNFATAFARLTDPDTLYIVSRGCFMYPAAIKDTRESRVLCRRQAGTPALFGRLPLPGRNQALPPTVHGGHLIP